MAAEISPVHRRLGLEVLSRLVFQGYSPGADEPSADIQTILADDVPMIVLYFQQQQDVVNLDLKNYYPASAVTPFWNTWQLEI